MREFVKIDKCGEKVFQIHLAYVFKPFTKTKHRMQNLNNLCKYSWNEHAFICLMLWNAVTTILLIAKLRKFVEYLNNFNERSFR